MFEEKTNPAREVPSTSWEAVRGYLESESCPTVWVRMDAAGDIASASQSFHEALLHDRPECRNFFECTIPSTADVLRRRMADDDLGDELLEVIHPVPTGSWTVAYQFRRDGDAWMLFGQDQSRQLELVAQMAGLIEDLEQEMKRERHLAERLQNLLANDHLTGLANRRRVEDTIASRWESWVASGQDFALISIDVDHFKSVNDRFGHDVGDEVLRRVARALEASVRSTDLAGRFGGEEFAVVVLASNAADAGKVAERIRSRIEISPMPDGVGRVTVSAGLAGTFSAQVNSAQELFKLSDQALYRAKTAGRNRVDICGQDG